MSRQKPDKRRKRVPMRTCVVCRETKLKREIVRLVHTSDHTLVVDARGKLPGRGAYLCDKVECWQGAAQGKQLDKALKAELTEEDRVLLKQYAL